MTDILQIPMFSPSEEYADEWNILKAEALQSANTDFSSLDKATLVSLVMLLFKRNILIYIYV